MPESGGRRKRALLVTRNMPPLVGGMERLNWHIADELRMRAEVSVLAPRGSAARAPYGIELIEVRPRPLSLFLVHATLATIRLAHTFRPDVVIAGSGLMAPVVEAAARLVGAKAVAYVHGLDLVVDSAIYKTIWLPSIRRMDRLVANSRYTAGLCKEVGARTERIGVVHPGVVIPSLPQASVEMASEFRMRHGLGKGPCLLSIGRMTARKGLREFVCGALPRIVARHPEARLVVVGGEATDALHSAGHSKQDLVDAATAAGVAGNLVFTGRLDDDEVEAAWAASTIHVFPIRQIPNDPEGFGMVAVEAAAHGVPTIAYAVGGVTDAVIDGVSGILVRPDDEMAFVEAVNRALTGGFARESVRKSAVKFGWGRFGVEMDRQLSIVLDGGQT